LRRVGRSHFLQPLLRSASPEAFELVGPSGPVATTIECAFDAATRKRGLLGRDGLAPGAALVIAPCSAVHTFRMRFPIDVIYAAYDGRVVKVRARMGAGRMSAAWNTFAVIEMSAGSAERAGLRPGDVLRVEQKKTD
jgi:uncharacterized membrane protein (UPF0127 family)